MADALEFCLIADIWWDNDGRGEWEVVRRDGSRLMMPQRTMFVCPIDKFSQDVYRWFGAQFSGKAHARAILRKYRKDRMTA